MFRTAQVLTRRVPRVVLRQRRVFGTSNVTSVARLQQKNSYPPIPEHFIEEKFIRGSGPGGQNVNKLATCVQLKHRPTGIIVKCHEARSQHRNRELARLRLQEKLDIFHHGDQSILSQEKIKAMLMKAERKRKTNRKLALLKAFKDREGIGDNKESNMDAQQHGTDNQNSMEMDTSPSEPNDISEKRME